MYSVDAVVQVTLVSNDATLFRLSQSPRMLPSHQANIFVSPLLHIVQCGHVCWHQGAHISFSQMHFKQPYDIHLPSHPLFHPGETLAQHVLLLLLPIASNYMVYVHILRTLCTPHAHLPLLVFEYHQVSNPQDYCFQTRLPVLRPHRIALLLILACTGA